MPRLGGRSFQNRSQLKKICLWIMFDHQLIAGAVLIAKDWINIGSPWNNLINKNVFFCMLDNVLNFVCSYFYSLITLFMGFIKYMRR